MESRRGRGRPPVITRDQIVRAARQVGLADLRMAAVAQVLNVRPAALYHHVRDRDELLQLVARQVLEETAYDDWIPRDSDDWRVWLRGYAAALRTALLEHAPLLRYIRLTTTATAGRLEQIEKLVEVLLAAGFDPETARHAIQYVHLLVIAEVREQGTAGELAPQIAEFQRALRARPPDELPLLRRLAATRPAPDPDEQFEFGVACLLAGLEARLAGE
ncbi:MAG: TetR/AcrR family transcriptional regulator C-terminal domain-containing protein [Micromonosporaceae bacterium]